MKKHHVTFVLMVLFFTGLIVLKWADYADIPTEKERRERVDRVLPELIDLKPTEIRRLEIDRERAKDRLVLERREGGNWQLIEPVDAAADPSLVETLARNLQALRKSRDAGTIEGSESSYGLSPPVATIRVFAGKGADPAASLELGLQKDGLRYVHEVGAPGIEVVDARLLNMLDRPAPDWREKALFTIPSFRVGALSVEGPGRDLKAERIEGKWTLVRPFHALAAEEKFEGVIAELTNLQVAGGTNGFIADNVKDGAPYGLDKPTMTVELIPITNQEKPQALLVGKPIPDKPDQFYARRRDQDEVVAIEIKEKDVRDLGSDPNAIRSQKVTDFNPDRAYFVRIEAPEITFELVKSPSGWQLIKPVREVADPPSVQSLLKQLAELQSSAFLDESQVADPNLDPPRLTIKVWQPDPSGTPTLEPGSEPKGEPRVNLRIGRYDPLRKVLFGRVAGDRTMLALPEPFRDALPRNALAFRDRTILSLSPGQVESLTIRRSGKTYVLQAPGTGTGSPSHWRMVEPVKANADDEAATRVLLVLSNLRAEELVSDKLGDGKAFGLDAPVETVSWTTAKEATKDRTKSSSGTLRVGSKVPKEEKYYANIAGSPIVFTLGPASLLPFDEEFHDRHVLSFAFDKVERLVLRWPDRTVSFARQSAPKGQSLWYPEPGIDVSGFDLNRLNSFVGSLAGLVTPKYLQYVGPFPTSTGLDHPQLTIQVVLEVPQGTRKLRVGSGLGNDRFAATAESGDAGQVFVLVGPAWAEMVKSPRIGYELPEDVFAPEP